MKDENYLVTELEKLVLLPDRAIMWQVSCKFDGRGLDMMDFHSEQLCASD